MNEMMSPEIDVRGSVSNAIFVQILCKCAFSQTSRILDDLGPAWGEKNLWLARKTKSAVGRRPNHTVESTK